MDFSNIVDHPDYQEIVSKVVTGVSPKDIGSWLKVKYPDKEQKHLHISVKSLQDFVDKHAVLMDNLRQEIVAIKNGDKIDRKLSASLAQNKNVQARLLEWADNEVDIRKTIRDFIRLAYARMEQVFDAIQQNPMGFKGDHVLVKYFETLFKACEQYDKIYNNSPDQVIQHNYSIQIMEQNVAMFQEAVRRTLAQMDTEASLHFMDIMSEEIKKMRPPPVVTMEDRKIDAQLLREMKVPELPQENSGDL